MISWWKFLFSFFVFATLCFGSVIRFSSPFQFHSSEHVFSSSYNSLQISVLSIVSIQVLKNSVSFSCRISRFSSQSPNIWPVSLYRRSNFQKVLIFTSNLKILFLKFLRKTLTFYFRTTLFQSGKVYLHRCNSPVSSSSDPKRQHRKPVPELQDLNFPPSPAEENLDLKLFPSNEYQSVCTLDKVKSALERAEKESGKKRHANCGSSDISSSRICSSLSSPSSPSVREGEAGDGEEEKSSDSFESGPVFAAGCPSCLLYVLLSKSNPKCPRCATVVPFRSFKKPRIDLNATVWENREKVRGDFVNKVGNRIGGKSYTFFSICVSDDHGDLHRKIGNWETFFFVLLLYWGSFFFGQSGCVNLDFLM